MLFRSADPERIEKTDAETDPEFGWGWPALVPKAARGAHAAYDEGQRRNEDRDVKDQPAQVHSLTIRVRTDLAYVRYDISCFGELRAPAASAHPDEFR